jgi:hypothetical protein
MAKQTTTTKPPGTSSDPLIPTPTEQPVAKAAQGVLPDPHPVVTAPPTPKPEAPKSDATATRPMPAAAIETLTRASAAPAGKPPTVTDGDPDLGPDRAELRARLQTSERERLAAIAELDKLKAEHSKLSASVNRVDERQIQGAVDERTATLTAEIEKLRKQLADLEAKLAQERKDGFKPWLRQ